MKIDLLSKKADYVGITGSVLCIIHCLITPVLLMTTALANDHTLRDGYLSLDYVFIGINIIAVYSATRHNTSLLIKRALWGFLALFVVALVLEEASPIFEYLAYTASAGLVVTHFTNIRYCRLKHSH